MLLEIKNLNVEVDGKQIINDFDLQIEKSKTYVLMGKNGSGKSSLVNTIVKNPKYEIKNGNIVFDSVDLKDKSVFEIARMGIFLSFQNAPSIDGFSFSMLLKNSVNSIRKAKGEEPLTAPQFFKLLNEYCSLLEIPQEWMKREVNVGFSGGEKKRLSMLEMLFLEPKLALLDEPDSGVDVSSINIIFKAVEYLKEKGTSFLVVSHYPNLISIINPDKVFVMQNGVIVKEGDKDLALKICEQGFSDEL